MDSHFSLDKTRQDKSIQYKMVTHALLCLIIGFDRRGVVMMHHYIYMVVCPKNTHSLSPYAPHSTQAVQLRTTTKNKRWCGAVKQREREREREQQQMTFILHVSNKHSTVSCPPAPVRRATESVGRNPDP